jgi:hypothetical protein
MHLKVKISAAECPIGKWSKVEEVKGPESE